VLVVRHVGLAGDVLVGHQLRLAVDDPVRECSSVHDRAQIGAPQLPVAAVVDVLVGGGAADGEDERLPDRVEDRGRLLGRKRVRVVAGAERRRELGGWGAAGFPGDFALLFAAAGRACASTRAMTSARMRASRTKVKRGFLACN